MTQIAKEYGAALFALACEQNAAEEYAAALHLIEQVLTATPEYLTLLACPSIPREERTDALRQAFSDRIPEDVLSFLQLLCERGRIDSLFDAAAEYHALLDQAKKTVHATVRSAVALTDAQKQRLERALEQRLSRTVKASYEIDGQLMGGFVVEVDGKTLDGSLRHRLHEIKEVMKT